MKWESTEPDRGNFTFADADRYVQYAHNNSLQIHCHNLVWHSQLPDWVSQGNFTNSTLIQVMEDHIKALAGRYRGQCTRWDVVNEGISIQLYQIWQSRANHSSIALNEDGTYRESVWYKTIGEAFLPIAFRLAAKYDPKAHLFCMFPFICHTYILLLTHA
jgi:endo-1,4-beta-xylanase